MDKNFGGCSDGNGQSQHLFSQEQWAYGYTAALGQVYSKYIVPYCIPQIDVDLSLH
jgi:hypothetical protein